LVPNVEINSQWSNPASDVAANAGATPSMPVYTHQTSTAPTGALLKDA
jgi:hypothetical protein